MFANLFITLHVGPPPIDDSLHEKVRYIASHRLKDSVCLLHFDGPSSIVVIIPVC